VLLGPLHHIVFSDPMWISIKYTEIF